MQGKLNSTIDVNGLLDQNFSPDLSTISGNALAEVLTSNIDVSKSPLLSGLGSQLNFIDFKELQKDIKTKLSFENGEVSVKPFTINYKDIPIEVSGMHTFTNNMKYDVVFNVPAKYLGGEVNRLIGQINDEDVNTISVPVTANINGNFSSPNISTDLTSGVSNLTKQLIEIKKQKLLGQGKDKINDLLEDVLGGNSKGAEKDSTSTEKDAIKEGVNSVLGGILGGRKKKKDTFP